jgi:hypothetical protein
MFPNNVVEQENYYLSNVLKKHVAQFNIYVVQLPCWYYSPSYNPSMILANIHFSEADLATHVPRMCPHVWQDQFNLHKKGMTPVDMCLLLMSLEAIECVCLQE